MPIQIKQDDSELMTHILIGFSFAQLVLGLILYIPYAINLWLVIGLGVLLVMGAVLTYMFWEEKKGIRVLIRCLNYAVVAVVVVTLAVTVVLTLVQNIEIMQKEDYEYFWSSMMAIICLFLQAVLLFVLPSMALAATRGYLLDLVMLRIFAVAELLIAGATILVQRNTTMMALIVDNIWFTIFFCLICMTTAVTSFVIHPIQWRPKALVKIQTRMEQVRSKKS